MTREEFVYFKKMLVSDRSTLRDNIYHYVPSFLGSFYSFVGKRGKEGKVKETAF